MQRPRVARINGIFSLADDKEAIQATLIPARDLMDFMITTCIKTKERALELFPVEEPANWNKDGFPKGN